MDLNLKAKYREGGKKGICRRSARVDEVAKMISTVEAQPAISG